MHPDLLLSVRDLRTHYFVRTGVFKRVAGYVKAVDGVSFGVRPRESLGIVGESGCGKSTVARTIMRSVNPRDATMAGEVLFRYDDTVVDLARVDGDALRQARKRVQMIFQDPESSLNPRMTIRDIIGEPLLVNGLARGRELDHRVVELMGAVSLDPQHLRRYPYAFSGGQRQRIGIARALALGPRLVIADEPTSALDVSVQAQVLNLLKDLRDRFSLSLILISHDLAVIKHVSDRVAVMYLGSIVEICATGELFRRPRMPYSEALLSAVTRPNPNVKAERILLPGDVPDPTDVPNGCPFHPRCIYAQERCRTEKPPLVALADDRRHDAACHLVDEVALRGI